MDKFDLEFALSILKAWPAKPNLVEAVMYEDALNNPKGLKTIDIDRTIKLERKQE